MFIIIYILKKTLKVILIPVVLVHAAFSTIPANWDVTWYFKDFWVAR